MSLDEARSKAREILCRKPQQVSAGLEVMGPAKHRPRFSVFITSDLRKAISLSEKWMLVTKARGEPGLDDVLADADGEMQSTDSDLVKHALMMFITHDPIGRKLPIPPLSDREPEVIVPSRRTAATSAAGLESLGGTGQEAALDYFREDTWINEHHAKWHVVYPAGGINGKLRNRQGELFWYMHQQMLARYDAERVSLGMQPVLALDDFTTPIAEGYDPEIPGGWAARPDDADWSMLPMRPGQNYGPKEHAARRDRLRTAAEKGALRYPDGADRLITNASQFVDTLEANIGSAEGFDPDPLSFYGNYHNLGHVLISSSGDGNGSGVMMSTTTAVRDPVFYRWHRGVDNIMDRWWLTHPAHDLDKSDPKGLAREIGVISASSLPPGDPQAWAEAQFGGANWGNAPAGVMLDRITTTMGTHTLTGRDGVSLQKRHLDHEEFYWLLRVENPTINDIEVTCRIFLVLEQFADTNRRAWIETDKFTEKLDAGARTVTLRSARLSSVVRKPALRPGEQPPPHEGPDDYCDCGWPYHLLVPRGSVAGTDFRLLVLLTDSATDQVRDEKKHKCGSLSFCGARDVDYPDKQEMDYPFNRPIDLRALQKRANVAVRTLKIVHV